MNHDFSVMTKFTAIFSDGFVDVVIFDNLLTFVVVVLNPLFRQFFPSDATFSHLRL